MVTANRLGLAYMVCLVVLVMVDLLLVYGGTNAAGERSWNGVTLDRPNLPAAGVLYLIYTTGLLFFGVWPAMAAGQIWLSLPGGLAYGAIASFGFALTSLTLRETPRGREMMMRGLVAGLAALTGSAAAAWLAA